MRKIYIIPNMVTTANMFFGFSSMIEAYQANFTEAAWYVFLAILCDLLDGRIARLAKATSSFGVEYDSLSDVISFGVAPAFIVYLWSLESYGKLGLFICFLFMACGALRLARFNISTSADSVPGGYFQGLPIPGGAAVMASFILFNDELNWPTASYIGPMSLMLMFACSVLMVSKVAFPSFKKVNWRSKGTYPILLAGVLGTVLAAIKPQVVFFINLIVFIGGTLIWNVFRSVKKAPLTQS